MSRAVKLRNGVSLAEGFIQETSPYYLIDTVQYREYAISKRMAAWLTGKTEGFSNLLNSKDNDRFLQFLTSNKLDQSATLETPTVPWYQRIVTQKWEILRPHDVLVSTQWLWGWLFSWIGVVLLCSLAIVATIGLVGRFDQLISYSGTYGDSKLAILVALVLVKIGHEFGHAMALVKNGAKVTNIGIVLIAGFPLPKTDGFGQYKLNYWQRFVFAMGGVYVEAILACLCALAWLVVDDGPTRSALHFIAVVSLPITLAINMLPLMKFDGYHVISAIVRSQTLYEDAIYSWKRFAYGLAGLSIPRDIVRTGNLSQAILIGYGAGIFTWKVFLPVGIIIGITQIIDARVAYGLGIFPIITMWIQPAQKEVQILMKSNAGKPASCADKKIRAVVLALLLLVLGWAIVPMPHLENGEGLYLRNTIVVKAKVEGLTTELTSSQRVDKEGPLTQIRPTSADIKFADVDVTHAKARVSDSTEALYLGESARIQWAYSNKLVNDGIIKAAEAGVWRPEKLKPVVSIGDPLGNLYLDAAELIALIPANLNVSDRIDARVMYPDGGVEQATFEHRAVYDDLSRYPEWVSLKQDAAYNIYVAPTMDIRPSSPIKMVYRRHYSIAIETLRKIFY